ncbi:copper-binding protein [Phyllobacterium zundukense]|uniref:Copper-binding protein n=1 Tax=Phyllobacterium zundukense TaxID=1867719 RepID=A0ACD4CXT8_9HYPH|nr:copper-binding protein [Phyllobacterium zundukense]UXN58431.1 copper-binding protein [Phyllobacterium zundukense]
MKSMIKTVLIALAAAAISTVSLAAEFTKGEVKKIDLKQKKITIKHEELKSLDMPAMTMVFVVSDDALLAKAKQDQAIEFVAEKVNGKLTVTEIK